MPSCRQGSLPLSWGSRLLFAFPVRGGEARLDPSQFEAFAESLAARAPRSPAPQGLRVVSISGPLPVYADIETNPDEDKFRLGGGFPNWPQPKLPPRSDPRKPRDPPTPRPPKPPLQPTDPFWPPAPPSPRAPGRPDDGLVGLLIDMLVEFLELLYCCYDMTADFTLGGELIKGGSGVDVKGALELRWESAEENKVGHVNHVGGWLSGEKLQEALDKRKGEPTDWDDLDLTFTLKPGIATSDESDPPSKSDNARREARKRAVSDQV